MKELPELTFVIPLKDNPPTVTSQEKGESIAYTYRNGRYVPYIKHFEKPEVQRARYLYQSSIYAEMKKSGIDRPEYDGPVSLEVVFCFKTAKRKQFGMPKITKPDCDNMVKLFQDVLDDLGFFKTGDQQVTSIKVSKYWNAEPCFAFRIRPIKERKLLPFLPWGGKDDI